MEEKEIVRSRIKQMRKNLPADQVRLLSTRICERLLSLKEIRLAETVLLYVAVRGEVNLERLHPDFSASGKIIACPRVRGSEMNFYEVCNASELVPGAFGIPEPASDARVLFPTSDEVILVPGVAFMRNGNRIGMGRGYYDRYLAQYPQLMRIGIAYEFQLEADWMPEEGDLPMDLIVTEHEVICCSEW